MDGLILFLKKSQESMMCIQPNMFYQEMFTFSRMIVLIRIIILGEDSFECKKKKIFCKNFFPSKLALKLFENYGLFLHPFLLTAKI